MGHALPPPLLRWMWLGAVALGLLAALAVQRFGVVWTLNGAALAPAAILLVLLPARWLLFVVVLLIPLGFRVSVGASTVVLPPGDFLVLPLVVATALQPAAARSRRVSLVVPDLLFLAFLAWAMASMGASRNLFSFWFSVKGDVIAYVVFRTAVELIVDRRHVLQGLSVMSAMLGLLVGVYLYWFVNAWQAGGVAAVFSERGSEGAGTSWANSNPLAAHLALPVPLAIALALAPVAGWRRVVSGGVAASAIAAVVLTSSRGAMVGLATALLGMAWAFRDRIGTLVTGAVVVTVTLAALVSLTPVAELALGRFETAGSDASSAARLTTWRAVASEIMDRPLLGHGFDNTRVQTPGQEEHETRDPHNSVLKLAYQVGLPGLALKLALLGWFARQLWRVRPRSRGDQALVAGFSGVLVCAAVNMMFESLLSSDRYQLLLYFIAALIVTWARTAGALGRPAHDTPRESSLPLHPTNTPA